VNDQARQELEYALAPAAAVADVAQCRRTPDGVQEFVVPAPTPARRLIGPAVVTMAAFVFAAVLSAGFVILAITFDDPRDPLISCLVTFVVAVIAIVCFVRSLGQLIRIARHVRMPFILRVSPNGHQVLHVPSTPWDSEPDVWDKRQISSVNLAEVSDGPFFRVVRVTLWLGSRSTSYEVAWGDRRPLAEVEQLIRSMLSNEAGGEAR
jgi:hypothetical protein